MLLLILCCVVFGVLAWFKKRRFEIMPPALASALPLIGHVHLLVGNNVHLWRKIKEWSYESLKGDGVVTFYFGPIVAYGLTDPDDFLTVANACLEKDNIYEFGKPWFGEGLLTGTASIWKIHRKLLSPAFNPIVLDGFLDVFNKQARRLVKKLEIEIDKESFNPSPHIKDNAFETICLTALGVDLNEKSAVNSQYFMAVDESSKIFMERSKKIWLQSNLIYSWSSLKRKQDEYVKIVHTMSNTVLRKTKADYLNEKTQKEANEQEPKFKAFMKLLLELTIEKELLSEKEIREEVDTMIAAGYETSATTLTFCLIMIGSYPKVQERIVKELHEVFGDDDRDVTKHDLSSLVYLEAVIKETVRVHPIIPVVARYLDKDVKLRNWTLSKGSRCFISIYGIHRSSIWGLDAEEFKPERWLDPARLPKSSNAFVGFSTGRRNCIGKTYALMSLKITLAHIFRNYKVQGDHTKMKLQFDITLKPISGHYISIKKINNEILI